MTKFNLDYYSGENFYSDGDIEKEILKIVRTQGSYENMDQVPFPVLYHLSRVRENILNWYPFRKDAACLEIGSGCGAISGLLCERMKKVVSVELSKQRADINMARHERLPNLEIWVGNLNDMVFGEKFDYIVLNGVFEYAPGFTEGDQPCETFLSNIRRLLKPDGVLLIAIENRFGLKYFAGAPEDHTNGYFDGIAGYPENHSVRTFSKGEWERLMEACGFSYHRFYYPYPDYKFPREVFTDESLKEQKYGLPTWNFTKYRMALFREGQVAETIQQDGQMDYFANSFLIEMSRNQIDAGRKVLYAKMSTDRDRHFSIATTIEEKDGRKMVVKRAMTAEAERHLKNMIKQPEKHGGFCAMAGKEVPGGIAYPFLEEESLAQQAKRAVYVHDIEKIKTLVHQVYQMCQKETDQVIRHQIRSQEMSGRERTEFTQVFGTAKMPENLQCIAPANIDLILDNIFEKDGKYCVIDCEWSFDFPVPVSFILWRTINELYSSYPQFEQEYPAAEFLKEYGITGEMADTFRRWGTYFAEHYVGANRLMNYSIPEIGISLEEFRQRYREKECLTTQLFVDTGNGFREEEKLQAETILEEGRFSVTFDLKDFKNYRALRFDPLEGKPCICQIDPQGTSAKLKAANAAGKVEKGDLFLTVDPVYQVNIKEQQKTLKIGGMITVLSMEEALERANGLLGKKNGLAFWRK